MLSQKVLSVPRFVQTISYAASDFAEPSVTGVVLYSSCDRLSLLDTYKNGKYINNNLNTEFLERPTATDSPR